MDVPREHGDAGAVVGWVFEESVVVAVSEASATHGPRRDDASLFVVLALLRV